MVNFLCNTGKFSFGGKNSLKKAEIFIKDKLLQQILSVLFLKYKNAPFLALLQINVVMSDSDCDQKLEIFG
jgi:hypothetical protein